MCGQAGRCGLLRLPVAIAGCRCWRLPLRVEIKGNMLTYVEFHKRAMFIQTLIHEMN